MMLKLCVNVHVVSSDSHKALCDHESGGHAATVRSFLRHIANLRVRSINMSCLTNTTRDNMGLL